MKIIEIKLILKLFFFFIKNMNFIEGIEFIRNNYKEYFKSAYTSYLTWSDESIFDNEYSRLCYVEIKEENLELILLTDLSNFRSIVMGYQIAIRENKENWKLNNICKFKKKNLEQSDIIFPSDIVLPKNFDLEEININSEEIPNYYGLNFVQIENVKYFTSLEYLSNKKEIELKVPEFNRKNLDRIRYLSKKDEDRTEDEEFEFRGLLNNFEILNIGE